MSTDIVNALIGGGVVGFSVSLMLLLNGRVTGISGIVNGTLSPTKGDVLWRLYFIIGLILGGFVIYQNNAQKFENTLNSSWINLVIAGLLVGFGSVMGSGCTSGHGVCGISRRSPRSIIATLVFMFAGLVSVLVYRRLGVIL